MSRGKNTTKRNAKADKHDAMPSWSGYNYQGKVAVYLVLEKINKHDSKTIVPDEWGVELEWLEDVSLVKNGKYYSIHQVKAKEDNHISGYKDAIWSLLGKADLFEAEKCYLHTISNMEEVVASDVYSLEPSEKVKHHYQRIRKKGKIYFNALFGKFEQYSYCQNKLYCEIDEIEEKINSQIELYYEGKKRSFDIDQVRVLLLDLINQHVVERHKEIHLSKISKDDPGRKIISLPFTKFIDVLDSDYQTPEGDYWVYKLREQINLSLDQYIIELEQDGETSEETLERLRNCFRMINQMDKKRFEEFYRKANPHKKVGNKFTYKEFRKLFQIDTTRDSFFRTLKTIDLNLCKVKFAYKHPMIDKFYLPTTIASSLRGTGDYYSECSKIAKNIFENVDTGKLLFEIDTMIASGIQIESLEKAANSYPKKGQDGRANQDQIDESIKNNITKIGQIRIVEVDTAREELKKNE